MKTVKLLTGIVCAVIGAAAFAKDVYVDNRSPAASDAATEGRGSESLPYLTIQAAIDAATTEAGDTVKVKPGVYATGGRVYDGDVIQARVVVDKAVDVVSTGGREVTEIVGKVDPSTGSYGEGAVKCVRVAAAANGKRIEGFTFRNGTTRNGSTWDSDDLGGGIYTDSSAYYYVVGCAFVNCRAAMGGGAYGNKLMIVRSFFTGCQSGSASNLSAALRGCRAVVSCVFASNGSYASRGAKLLNCTFVNNSGVAVTGGSAYNCLSVGNGTDFENTVTTQNCIDTSAYGSKYAVVSPASGDFRPIAGSATIGAGAEVSSIVSSLSLPASYCDKDFDGNTLPSTGEVDVGAVQGGVTPIAGRIDLASGSSTYKKFVVDEHLAAAGEWLRSEEFPAQWLVHPESSTNTATSLCIGVKLESDAANRLVPDMNGNVGLLLRTNANYTATAYYSAGAKYVSDADGDDVNGNGTAASPYKSIQRAIDSISADNYVVYVAPGDYNSVVKPNGSVTNRVYVNRAMLIRGAGAGKSVIWGAPDPSTGGTGTGAIRALYSTSVSATVQGFTIRDSYAPGTSESKQNTIAAYAVGAFHLCDCTVTNCVGFSDPGTGNGLLSGVIAERCRFVGNVNMSVYSSRLAGCHFEGNTASVKGLVSFYAHARNCTFIGKSGYTICGGISGPATVSRTFRNCIFDTSTTISTGITSFTGGLLWNYSSSAPSGFTKGDPVYADVARGDRRVLDFSTATTCGDWTSDGDAYKYISTGLDGKKLSFKAGKAVVGAYYGAVEGDYAYVSAANGGITVEGGAIGGNVFDAERTITLTATNATRPCIGYTVNGVTNLFDETPSRIIDRAAAAEGLHIDAIYTTDWYIDAENGDDSRLGYTPNSAKRTIIAAMTNATIVSGDTVHAAPGDYCEGEYKSGSDKVYCRAAMKPGVTLVADEGPTVTFISGAAAPGSGSDGNGAGAVRCVGSLNSSKGGPVRSFTLRNGHTHTYNGTGSTWSDWHGSAAINAVLEDCVVTNCVTAYGTCSGSTVRRCRIYGNSGAVAGTYSCSIYDTVFDDNKSPNNSVVTDCSRLVGCTFGAGNSGKDTLYVASSCVVSNCLVLCDSKFVAGVATPGTYFAVAPTVSGGGSLPEGATLSDADHLKLDANWMPVYGSNIAIDALDAVWANGAGLDATGGQRVYNGRLDAGAVEYDFRLRIPRLLRAGRHLEVLAASPDVVEDVDGVRINAGKVDAKWKFQKTADRSYRVSVSVSGGGTLTVYANGVAQGVYDAGSGHVDVVFASQLAENSISLVYSQDPEVAGYGTVYNAIASSVGVIMIVY